MGNKILAIIASHKWSPLYDAYTNNVIGDGTIHLDLNNHFYSSLSSSMKNNNAKIMSNKQNLHQDSVGFFRAL